MRTDRLRAWARTRPAGPGFQIRNAAETPTVTEVLLYDEIGFWGIEAREFVPALNEIDTDEIHLRINSPGGDAYDGIAILNALRRHKAKITTFVDGIAASAASFIAMAGDEVVMSRNAEMMIHDAWGLAIGNAADMRELAERLDKISANIASIYAGKAGGKVADWRAAMEAETWYGDTEAVEAGLADRVETNKTAGDKAKNRWDLTVFAYNGRANAPTPPISLNRKAVRPPAQSNTKGTDMPDELIAGLRERFGGLDGVDDAAILAAMTAAMNTVTDPEDDETEDETEGDETEEDGDGDTEGTEDGDTDGTVVVDEPTLNQLRSDAQAGREARNQQERERREALVSAAVADGRIEPARRAAWLNTLTNDPGAEATLAKLAKGLVPVDGPVGYAGGLTESGDDDGYYALFPDEHPRNKRKVG